MAALNSNVAISGKRRFRLDYIDGMRGMSALYVALYHAFGDSPPISKALHVLGWFLQFGHYAVGVFIVLSGYCLMCPVVQTPEFHIEGGIARYASRRVRRILPAYYVVLTLAIAAVAMVQTTYHPLPGEEADVLRLSPGTVLSHILLLQNLQQSWARAFDPPMWSVAAECQIYVLFPLVLLPIWRRFGSTGAITVAFALGLMPHFLLRPEFNFDWTFPWYLGLFCLGMAAAAITHGSRDIDIQLRREREWKWIALVSFAIFATVAGISPDMAISKMWVPDTLLGLAMTALLIWLGSGNVRSALTDSKQTARSTLVKVLSSAPARTLGSCSYSLYLLHAPVLWALACLLAKTGWSDERCILIRLMVGVPAAVGVAFLSYLGIERPFLGARS